MMKAIVIRTFGDPEMAEALRDGIEKGTRAPYPPASRGTSPSADGEAKGRLTREQIEVVEAEIDRQHILEALVRVAVGNTKTAADYALMENKARADYAEDDGRPAWLRRMADRALGLYGLAVMALAAAYRAQDAVLGTEGGRKR